MGSNPLVFRRARSPSPSLTYPQPNAQTYQVELLAFVLLGLGTGYHFMNIDAPITDRPDPCCADIDPSLGESEPLIAHDA